MLAERIKQLFMGYSKAHGKYEVRRTNERGKAEGRAITVTGPATTHEWGAHIEGSGPGIGIIPLGDNDCVSFAAIDIDKYDLSFDLLEDKIRHLPLTICRSKSGGAHLYIFFSTPAPASEAIDALSRWAAEIGHGGCEIFPKQTYRVNEKDIGNWINMPYFNAKDTLRYAYANGEKLSLEEFLDLAESRKTTVDKLDSYVKPGYSESTLFEEGPPCLQQLESSGGFPDGTRNEGMFNTVVFLKRKFPDNWAEKMSAYNVGMCDPPLPPQELVTIQRTHEKKEYGYRCKQTPIFQHCNRRVCLRRRFGVGETESGSNAPEITSITKYDGKPPFWGVDLGGARVIATTEQLFSQAEFSKLCMETLNRIPASLPRPRWQMMLNEKLQNADVVPVPEEAGHEGQFWVWFERFCYGKAQAKRIEEVLTDKPFFDKDKVYFTLTALVRYLEENKVQYKSHTQLWIWVKAQGGESVRERIGGKQTRLWVMPAPEKAVEASPAKKVQEEVF